MITYDDSNLRKLFSELRPKRRRAALKGAMTRAATSVKKSAAANLKATGIHNAAALSRGISSSAFRRTLGFKVTVKSSGNKGFHVNRRGLKKPVLRWAETGTKRRKTRRAVSFFCAGRWRQGRNRGSMPRFGFMEKTRDEVKGPITAQVQQAIVDNIQKTARKYGCH